MYVIQSQANPSGVGIGVVYGALVGGLLGNQLGGTAMMALHSP